MQLTAFSRNLLKTMLVLLFLGLSLFEIFLLLQKNKRVALLETKVENINDRVGAIETQPTASPSATVIPTSPAVKTFFKAPTTSIK